MQQNTAKKQTTKASINNILQKNTLNKTVQPKCCNITMSDIYKSHAHMLTMLNMCIMQKSQTAVRM